jgi:hypothetical protein
VTLCFVRQIACKHSPVTVYMQSLCCVTAFVDIQRAEWKEFARPTSEYLRRFKRLLRQPQDIVVFIDTRLLEPVIEMARARLESGNSSVTQVIPVDENFLLEHIPAFKKVEADAAIMQSDAYRARTRHRSTHPEHCNPLYTAVNHAKIDFVAFATSMFGERYTHFAWVDFGLAADDELCTGRPLVLDKLDPDRANYVCINDPEPEDGDPLQTLVSAREVIAGGFFCLPKSLIERHQRDYHSTCDRLRAQGIADDDQAIVVNMHARAPERFALHRGGYCTALAQFS